MSEDEHPPLQIKALSWGVKESFRRYVASTGAIETFGAATRAEDGSFIFPVTATSDLRVGADGVLRGHAAFSGEVHFKAHGGALDVRLTDPIVAIGEKAGIFLVAEAGGKSRRVEFAALNMTAVTLGPDEILLPAKLDWDGSEVLDNHYPATTPIDPVRLILDAQKK